MAVKSWRTTPIEPKAAKPAEEPAVCVWAQHKLAGPELPPEVGVATAKIARDAITASLENIVENCS